MAKIQIEIDSCDDCPFVKKDRCYTEDSFSLEFDYLCSKTLENDSPKKIAGCVSWNENVKIPKWCPISVRSKDEQEYKTIRN